MTALTLHTAFGTGPAWTPVVFVKARRTAKERAEAAATRAALRNMVLFLIAPFVGLAYAILLPFVGLGMLAWFAVRALVECGALPKALRVAKKVLLVGAAPFAGLAYVIALPFAGLGLLAWFGARAIMAAPAK